MISRRLFCFTSTCILFLTLLVASAAAAASATENGDDTTCKNDSDSEADTCATATGQSDDATDKGCRLYLARSTIPNSGLGVFSANEMPARGLSLDNDIIIQMPDPSDDSGLSLLLNDYAWDGRGSGGQYEGYQATAILPGMGMLANSHPSHFNALPVRPTVDNADVNRSISHAAGAFTHYHNHSFVTHRPIPAGGEVLVNYGGTWLQQKNLESEDEESADKYTRSADWLRENGICLDNIRPGRSTIADAGRGAFATRFLPKDSIVAPVPVVQITSREALRAVRVKVPKPGQPNKGGPPVKEKAWQLLRNYCFGHPDSTMLLFPYGMAVNLVNHDVDRVNAVLRWSHSTQHAGRDWPESMSLDDLKAKGESGLMLELVATRNIELGEEIFIDYGPRWSKAWEAHNQNWKPVPDADKYKPSFVMNNLAHVKGSPYEVVRTEKEELEYHYPENTFTSCYYSYAGNAEKANPVKYEMVRGLLRARNLRPCTILQRKRAKNGKDYYQVKMHNWYGMSPEEFIPEGKRHVVNGLPREAIQYSDHVFTTDQHLKNAFRHEIDLPDGVFPEAWMDLKGNKNQT